VVPYDVNSRSSEADCKLLYSVYFTFTYTHAHTTILDLSGFYPGNLGEPVPEETFTHSHLSWTSVVPYLLHASNTIHGILPVQFTCLTVLFHNLSPSFLWST